jgi:predicted transposase YdaD
LVLLRPKATASDLTGQLDINGANGVPYLTFRYTVVRVWLESFSSLLAAGPGLTPLALLTNEAATDLPNAFGQFLDQLKADKLTDNVIRSLLGSTFVLCGLRYTETQIKNLYRNLSMTLEDSTTYQLIFNKGIKQGEILGEVRGEARGEQTAILLAGSQRFGAATPAIEATVRAITDRARLERILVRVFTATDWNDLLATP